MKKEILNFKKYKWVKTSQRVVFPCNEVWYKYRVYRKYFRNWIPLSNTKCSYDISKQRWEYIKSKLKNDPTFIPQKENWAGRPYKRIKN